MAGDGVGFRQVLGSSGFRWLVAVRLSGALSVGLVQAALATFVLFSPERAATPAKVAVSFAVLLLPYSLVGPFAGVLLDRWSRRQILVLSYLAQAVLAAVLAALVAHERDGADLALTVLLLLAVNRFVLAAISAGTPHVVPAPYLVTANAIAPTLGTAASVVGGLLGVALRTLDGQGDHGSVVVLAVAVATYVAAALVATRLAVGELGPDAGTTRESLGDVVRGTVAGARHLHSRPRAWRAIALVAAQRATFGITVAVAVLQVRGALHPPDDTTAALRDLTVATGVAGAGAFLGAVVTPKLAQRFGAVPWSATAVIGGVCLGAVGAASATLPGLLAMGFCIGFGGQAAKVCADTIVQAEIDDAHRGRVFSLYDVAVNVAIVAGVAFAVFTAAPDGRSLLVLAVMVTIGIAASALAYRADRRDVAVRPVAEQTIA